jgi:hypothetical protein
LSKGLFVNTKRKASQEEGLRTWPYSDLREGAVDKVPEKDMVVLEPQRKKLG